MTDAKIGASRRELLGGAAVGLAAASIPAFAQEQHSPGAPTSDRLRSPPSPSSSSPGRA